MVQVFLPRPWLQRLFQLLCLCSGKLRLPVFTCLPLQSWEQLSSLFSPLVQIQEELIFQSVLLVVKTEWQLLNSSHVEPGNRSVSSTLDFFWLYRLSKTLADCLFIVPLGTSHSSHCLNSSLRSGPHGHHFNLVVHHHNCTQFINSLLSWTSLVTNCQRSGSLDIRL